MTPIFSIRDDRELRLQSVVFDKIRKGFYAGYVVESKIVQCMVEVRLCGPKQDPSAPALIEFVNFKDKFKDYEVFLQSGRFEFGNIVKLEAPKKK